MTDRRYFLVRRAVIGRVVALAVLAGVFTGPAQAVNRPTFYSPYTQVSNLTTGMAWPVGQALPTFATPFPTLDTILIQDLTPDEQVTFSALEGLVNKTRPRIYLLDSGSDEGTYTWATTSTVNFASRTLYTSTTKYSLLAKYASQVSGVVLYNPTTSTQYRNVASTVAGLKNAIPVTSDVYTTMTNNGIHLNVVADLTGLTYTSAVDIYNYVYTTYWPLCTKRVIVSANPDDTGDLHHTRDIAAATGAAVVWLSTTTTSERNVLKKFLADMSAGAGVVLGWYTTERSGIGASTTYGIGTVPSDFYISGTVYGGTDHRIRAPKVPAMPTLANKVYISIIMSDGDNAQYIQRAMRKIWDQNAASRGIFPISWTISPAMVDLGPALLNYYYSTATTNDCFIAGPSGMGYILPVNTSSETGVSTGTLLTNATAMDGYASMTETYMQRAGLRVLTVWDNATDSQRASYESHVRNLYGATVQLFSGNSSVVSSVVNNRVRFDRLVLPYAEDYTSVHDALAAQIASWTGTAPLFLSVQVAVWGEMKPNRIVDLCNDLNTAYPGKLSFVRADHYFNLYNQANNLPFNLAMSPQTTVTSSDPASTPSVAIDGTPASVWGSSAAGARYLTFNFGKPYNLSRYVIRHAGDAGQSQTLNTKDYRVRVSLDGSSWSTIDTYIGNTANVTDVQFPVVSAQYVQLIVDNPGADTTARIADVELYGKNATQIIAPVPDSAYTQWMDGLPPAQQPPEGKRGETDAPAGDQMTNLFKYALGLQPLTPSAQDGPQVAAAAADSLAIEVTRSKTTTAQILMEGSTDLKTWTAVNYTETWLADVGTDRERVQLQVAKPDAPKYYVRLKVVE